MSGKRKRPVGSRRTTPAVEEIRSQARQASRRMRPLEVQELEDRTLLSVTATLAQGVLDVSLSASGDQAMIAPSGSSIVVSGTNDAGQTFSNVSSIAVLGSNSAGRDVPNQGVTFGGSGGTIALHSSAGTDALSVTGVTSASFSSVTIDATSGNVDVLASETTSAAGTQANAAPATEVLVSGATIQADNVTLDAVASSSFTYSGALGGALNSLGVAAAVDQLQPSATTAIVGASTKVLVNGAGGNITIGSQANVYVDSTATVGKTAQGNALNPVNAAVAESVVNSTAYTHVSGGATVAAGGSTGTASITSADATGVTTEVDGSGAVGGGSAAVTLDTSSSQAVVNGGSAVSGGTVDVSATTTNSDFTTAKSTATGAGANSAIQNILAGKVDPGYLSMVTPPNPNPADKTSPALTALSGGLPLGVAGAVAVNKFTPTTQASVAGATITAGFAINIDAAADNYASTLADGEATTSNASNSVGVAVAIGDTLASNTATVEGTSGLSAPTVSIQAANPALPAAMPNLLTSTASATSGASGTNVGLAGALALDIVSNTNGATVPSGSTISSAGDLLFNAQDDANESATAQPPVGFAGGSGAGKLGVGASVALDIASNTDQADLADSAQLTGAHNLAIDAGSDDTVSTNAIAGSSGGAASISPSAGISVVNNTTDADLGAPDAAGDPLVVGGSLSANAIQTGLTSTATGAGAGTGSTVSAGVAAALAFVTNTVNASPDRSIDAQGGGVTFLAQGSAASLVSSNATATGAPMSSSGSVDAQDSQQRSFADSLGTLVNSLGKAVSAGSTSGNAATPSAKTSNGLVTLAAAVSVNDVNTQATATIPNGLTITATGPLTVQADDDTGSSNNVDYGDTANAWGTDAGTAKLGVGAAVALNLVNASTRATIGQGDTIHADGLTVKAGMLGTDPLNVFGALAVSGAGAGSVGVAGAVAINIVTNASQALVEAGASVAAGGGNVSVNSLDNSTDTTLAQPAGTATGSDLGIGASLGLNIITDTTYAEVDDGAALTGAGNVSVVASSDQTIDTWGQDGAAGGISIGGGVAVAIASDSTLAYIGASSQALNLTGNLLISADGSSTVNTLANSAVSAGQTVGIGASVAVNDTQDAFNAELFRNVAAGGTVIIGASAASTSQATSVASEMGGSSGDQSADQKVLGLFNFGKGEGGSSSPNVAAPPTSNGQLSSGAGSAGGVSGGGKGQTEVGLAASVAVNVLTSYATANIDGGLTVTAGGALTVATTNQDAALALADGRATSNKGSIGAAVSLNVANATNTATIHNSDVITAHGVSVSASMPGQSPNDFSTQALGVADGSQAGVAGSAGINAVGINTNAAIDPGSVVNSFGGLTVQSLDDETLQNIAFTGAVGKLVGAGAAVNVNILNNSTLASLASNVQANVADATQVLANSSLTPSLDPVPNSPTETTIASGTLTRGSYNVTSLDGAVLGVEGGSVNTPFDGEPVSGVGIPSGTLIVSAGNTPFTGILAFGTNTIVTDDPALLNPLHVPKVGQTVSGPGVVPGTTITNVSFSVATGYTLTMSAPIIANGSAPLVLSSLLLSQAATTSGPTILSLTPLTDVTTELSTLHPTNFAAGIGASSGGAGIAGSFVVNVINQATNASIGNDDMINVLTGTTGRPATDADQDVLVMATGTMTVVDWAGAIGGGDDVGFGAALDVDDVNQDNDEASIGSGSVVHAARNVKVTTSSNGSFSSITAAAGLSASVGIAGAASVEALTAMTIAALGDTTTVDAGGSLLVQASRQATVTTVAGQVVAGEDASVGASNSTVIDNVATRATTGANDQITALGVGSGSTVNALTGQMDPDGNEATTPVAGVAVVAASFLSVTPTSVGGAISLFVGVAGSVDVDDLTLATQALIGQGSMVNANDTGAGSTQDVDVLASDQTTLNSGAGALELAGGGLGAGVDVSLIGKTTVAEIGASATVEARRNVEVTAFSQEQLSSGTGSASGGGIGLAGAVGVYVLNLGTSAEVGIGAKVQASGNVLVTASDPTTVMMIAGTVAIGGSAGVGGSVVVPVITKVTTAYVAANAVVDAQGQAGGSTVDDGRFIASYNGTAQGTPQIKPGSEATSISALTENRTVMPETRTIRGLAVVATSTDRVMTYAASGGGGEIGASVAGSAFAPNSTTEAWVGDGAQVDMSGLAANAAQSVLVAAGADYYHVGVGGALTVAGSAGVAPGVDLTLAMNTTEAFIGNSAMVAAAQDVDVMASQGGAIVSFALGLGASPGLAVAGAVSLFSLNDKTLATIGQAAGVAAGGNVLVSSEDDTGSSTLDGTGALGFGLAGVGASIGVNLITKNTQAYIDAGAVVDAEGQNTTAMTVYQDSPTASGVGTDGSFATTTAYGVAVQAGSSEGVFAATVTGAASDLVALAGAVTVDIIGATTEAYIGSNALINYYLMGGPLQSVNVAAADNSSIQGVDGALALSNPIQPSLALAGGVDVGIIRDQTSAFIDAGAKVDADDNVDVFALAYKHGDSLALSLGLGAIGIAGSVAVYAIDAGVSGSAMSSLKAQDKGDSNTTGSYADSQANASSVTGQLGGYQGSSQSDSLVEQSVGIGQANLQAVDPIGLPNQDISASPPPMGTSAFIGAATVFTNTGNVDVEADEVVVLHEVTGGGTLGLATGGASVSIATIGSLTQAFLANGASVNSGGDVDVHSNYFLAPPGYPLVRSADTPLPDTPMVAAYGGNLGLVVGLGAQVAIVNDDSVQGAHIGETATFGAAPTSAAGGAQVLAIGNVLVEADANRSLVADADGGTGGAIAAGAAVAQAFELGSTRAYLGDDAQVGQASGTVGSLGVIARSTSSTTANCFAVAVGIGVGTYNLADSENEPSVQASTGTGSQVQSQGDVTIDAASDALRAVANETGVAASGIAIGVARSDATLSPVVNAFLGGGSSVTSPGGNIAVEASEDLPSPAGLPPLGSIGAEASGSASETSLATGDGANITSSASAYLDAAVDGGVTLLTPQDVTISANGSNAANSYANTLSIGILLNVAEVSASATASGTDLASIGGAATVGTAAQPVGNLTVDATGTKDEAGASTDLSGGGAFNGFGGDATATTDPTIHASIDLNLSASRAIVPTVVLTNDLTVQANSAAASANAYSTGAAGGIVDVHQSQATTYLEPSVDSSIDNLYAKVGGNINLGSQATASTVANSVGSGGGFVEIGGAESDPTADPTVTTEVGFGTILAAGNDINITSNSTLTVQSIASNSADGFIAYGKGMSTVAIDNTNDVTIGNGAVVAAQGDVTLQDTSTNTLANCEVDSNGGGFAPTANAFFVANLDYQTLISVGTAATVQAGQTLLIGSSTNTSGTITATTGGSGSAGSGDNSSVNWAMGSKNDNSNVAETQATIGQGATLSAQDATVLAATTFNNVANSVAVAPPGVVGFPSAAASSDANETSHVSVQPGAKITGTHSVNIEAQNNDDSAIATTQSFSYAAGSNDDSGDETVISGPSKFAGSSQPGLSQVDASPGAAIITPDLFVQALATFGLTQDVDNSPYIPLAHSSRRTNLGQLSADRTIHWNADVYSTAPATANTVLTVNANGQVDPSSNITPTITPTQIIVPNIGGGTVGGTITFMANLNPFNEDLAANQETSTSNNGLIDGNQATFYYQTASGNVTIHNASTKELVVNNIDTLDAGKDAKPNVDINVFTDRGPSPFAFNVAYSSPSPTLIDIENTSPTGSPEILLDGEISNPVGTTRIIDASGSILTSGSPGDIVTANDLDVSAPAGQVGSSTAPLVADLVQSETSQGVQRPINVAIAAGGGAYLNLTGLLRDPAVNVTQTPFVVPLGSIVAGGDVVAALQQAVQESSAGSAPFGIIVYEDFPDLTTPVSTHFRPGTGTGPAESLDPGFGTANPTPILSTYSFANLTAGGNISLDGNPGGQLLNIVGSTNINPTPGRTGLINAYTNGNITLTETAGALRAGRITSETGVGNITLNVPNDAATGDDFVMGPNGSLVDATNGSVTINAADNITVPATGGVFASSTVLIQGDYQKQAGVAGSVITIAGLILAKVATIDGGPDDDVISLNNTQARVVTTVNTVGGVNTVNVGSIPPPTPNGGLINMIEGPLTVNGTGADTLNVDDTGSTAPKTGTLGATTLLGLGMGASGIAYKGLATLNIDLGSGGNTFTVANTAPGATTTLDSGTGKDTVTVQATSSPLTVNTQAGTDTVDVRAIGAAANVNAGGGNDTINVSSDAPTNQGTLAGITAALTIAGGSGRTKANLSDIGDRNSTNSYLGPLNLVSTVLGATGAVDYSSLAVLDIALGSGGNSFDVVNTAKGTTTTLESGSGNDNVTVGATSSPLTVDTQAGNDTLDVVSTTAELTVVTESGSDSVNVQAIGAPAVILSGGSDTIDVSSDAPKDAGVLAGIAALLTVDGSSHTILNVSDQGDALPTTGTLSASSLTLSSTAHSTTVAYNSLASLNIQLGTKANTFNIYNTAPVTTTQVIGGPGVDTVDVQAVGGPTTVNTGTGTAADVVNVGSLAPIMGGVLGTILAPLTVIGDGSAALNVDDRGDTTARTGILTASALNGLGLASSGIAYQKLAALNIALGRLADVFDVRSSALGTTTTITTQATKNTWDVGSLAPTVSGGVLSGIQGTVNILGGGTGAALTDAITFDDSGSKAANESGSLYDASLTGLGMGGSGVTFVGQATLNINLGDNKTTLDGYILNNLPATTTITGGPSNNDSLVVNWVDDFNGTLDLAHLGYIDLGVNGQYYGALNVATPNILNQLSVLGSVQPGSSISAGQVDILTIGVSLNTDLDVPGIPGAAAGTDALGYANIGNFPAGIVLTAGSIGEIDVNNNLAGSIQSGPIGTLHVFTGSITTTATVAVDGDLNDLYIGLPGPGGVPDKLSVGQNMAGYIGVSGTLGTTRIAGGTPGDFFALHVGTIGAYGGFGPVVLRVSDGNGNYRVELAAPGQFYLQPNNADVAGSPYVNLQYLYESAGFSSPQLSATITNNVSSSPDQFDLSTVALLSTGATDPFTNFNVARIDSVGVSGLRNLAVEGSLVPGVSVAAASFFEGDEAEGVYLPKDDIAGIGIRDYAPDNSIVAGAIQGVAFGSFTDAQGVGEPGSDATNLDAARLLGVGTRIVPAGSVSGVGSDTFRVPFAALPGQQVAFFLDTAPGGGTFDPNNMIFTLQSNGDGVHAATVYVPTRGAVTAMINVDETIGNSTVQTVDLYGDGGSIFSDQYIARSITSTGPLGDVTILAPQGLDSITAPSIFGNIAAAGPIFGTIQTTGVRTDPVSGATSMIAADLGRAYVVQTGGRNPQTYVTTTTIEGQGPDSFPGRIVSRGNLISSVRSDGGSTGLIAVQGNLGAVSTLLGTPTRVGGLLVNGGFSGQLVVMGDAIGDLTFHGGVDGGRVAVQGTGAARSGILGNVIVDRGIYPTGAIGAGSAIVSGGEIGDASSGTSLSVADGNQGIVAALGTIAKAAGGNLGGSVFNQAAGTANAAAIDAIFTDQGQPLALDLPGNPLGGLELILQDLAALYVNANGKLAGPKA